MFYSYRYAVFRYGPGNYGTLDVSEDILLLFLDFASEKLLQNNIWCVDKTFSVIPAIYVQLHTTSCIKEHLVFPFVFAVLKNKKKETYKKLHDLVCSLIGNVSPMIIKTGFKMQQYRRCVKLIRKQTFLAANFILHRPYFVAFKFWTYLRFTEVVG